MIENPDGFRIGFLMNNVAIYYKTTGIVDEVNLSVDNFILYQNYPNPFNPSTNISYGITQSGLVTLKIYDVLGTEIETLVNEEKPVGTYELNWNAANLPSGVYFYRLQAGALWRQEKWFYWNK